MYGITFKLIEMKASGVLIEAGMAVRYDGGKKTHKWCE